MGILEEKQDRLFRCCYKSTREETKLDYAEAEDIGGRIVCTLTSLLRARLRNGTVIPRCIFFISTVKGNHTKEGNFYERKKMMGRSEERLLRAGEEEVFRRTVSELFDSLLARRALGWGKSRD